MFWLPSKEASCLPHVAAACCWFCCCCRCCCCWWMLQTWLTYRWQNRSKVQSKLKSKRDKRDTWRQYEIATATACCNFWSFNQHYLQLVHVDGFILHRAKQQLIENEKKLAGVSATNTNSNFRVQLRNKSMSVLHFDRQLIRPSVKKSSTIRISS